MSRNITTELQRLSTLRPLSPESDASLAAAWDVRMVECPYHFTGLSRMIQEPRP